MTHGSDILVIGGGIAGVSAAAFLSGEASVTLLEAETAIGYHSTGRSAAIFFSNYGNRTIRELNAASRPFFEDPGDFTDETLLSPRGMLSVATPAEAGILEKYAAQAPGTVRVTVDEACRMVPIINRDVIASALFEAEPSDIDVDRFLQALARRLRANDGRIANNAPAGDIRFEDGVWRVSAANRTFEAPLLVNAAGAWADEVAQKAGISPVGIQPMRRSAAIIPAPAGHTVDDWPMLLSASESWYAKPEAGKLMVSPADEDPVDPHDAWADDMVLAEGLHRFEQAVTEPVTHVETSWAGLRSFVADRTPVCGFAPGASGFFWLAGQGGYGVQTAPAMARLCADLCLGRSPVLPAQTVAALSPQRFS